MYLKFPEIFDIKDGILTYFKKPGIGVELNERN